MAEPLFELDKGGLVLLSRGGKVTIMSEETILENAYHLGKRDERRRLRARLETSDLPGHMIERVLVLIDRDETIAEPGAITEMDSIKEERP